MTRKFNSPVRRVDPDFDIDMRGIAKIRLEKGLAKLNPRELSLSEMTRLLRRTQGYRASLEELRFKPKKETIRNIRK